MINSRGFKFEKPKDRKQTQELRLCLYCHREFPDTAARRYNAAHFGQGKFCSPKCAALSKAKRRCRQCGAIPPRAQMSFCGDECKRKYVVAKRRYTATGVCLLCGKDFEYVRRENNGKYCSRLCWDRSRHREFNCAKCGKVFTRRAGDRRPKKAYCSKECAKGHLRGANHPKYRGRRQSDRGPTWIKDSTLARQRDNNTCASLSHRPEIEHTLRRVKLSVDHVIPYRLILEWRKTDKALIPNHPENLIAMCRRCHCEKTQIAEPKILIGDIVGFVAAMRRFMDVDRLARALKLYGMSMPGVH